MNVQISEAVDILKRGGYDISQSLIREYEKQGLLAPAKTESSYRLFSVDDINKIRFILIARMLNVPVKNIKLLLDLFSGKQSTNSIYQGEELEKYLCAINGQATTVAHDVAGFSEKITSLLKKQKR